MWKIVAGFIVFAAIALYVVSRAGDKASLGGEAHSMDPAHPPASAASH